MLLALAEYEAHLTMTTNGLAVASAGLSLLGLILLIVGASYWLSHRGTRAVCLVFSGLTSLKFLAIAWLKIAPTSDFWNYHALAAFSAQGMTWHQMWTRGLLGNYVIFPHSLNIANFFSLITAFLGANFFISQLTNVLCTLLDMWLIYWLGARWLSRQMGLIASLIFYCIPAYWLYSTLLNGAEPLFVTFVLLTLLALTKALQPAITAAPNDPWLNLCLALIATLAANMLRPIMTVWLIAVLLFTGVHWLQTFPRKTTKRLWLYLGGAMLLLTSSAGLNNWLYGIQLAPSNVETTYSLATGTNVATQGTYNAKIMGQVTHQLKVNPTPAKAYSKLAQQLTQDTQLNVQQLQQQHRWFSFIDDKMQQLLGPDYGYNWVLYNLQSRRTGNTWYRLRYFVITLSAAYFGLMLIAALIASVLGLRQLTKPHFLNQYFFMSALLFDGFTLSNLILEVQGRYHVIIYLPLIALIICGIAALKIRYHQSEDV
ncbi:integral membrane protein [Lactiplantibacillus fabifermentans DSM 21115]|nr:integral membrane protein [Lactiplantibacillus fabifermentans DSM 21115]